MKKTYIQPTIEADILYLESIKDSHKIRLYLHAASYDFTSTLQDARQQLGRNFIQCHKTCVVNLLHISRLIQEGHKIQLDNGVICSCATRSWKTVKDRYLQSYQAKL